MAPLSVDFFNQAHTYVVQLLERIHNNTIVPMGRTVNRIGGELDQGLRDINAKLDVITSQTASAPATTVDDARQIPIEGPASPTLTGNPLIQQTPSATRFFSDSNAVLSETQRITRILPSNTFPMQPSTLPTDELFGQLHALHQNLLQWSIDIDNRVQQLASSVNAKLDAVTFNSANQVSTATLNRLLEELHANMATSQRTGEAAQTMLEHLADIQRRLPSTAPSDALQQLIQLLSTNRPVEETTPTATPHSELPALNPVHNALRCRTYGSIEFNGQTFKRPIDFVGRPPSTTLHLRLDVRRAADHTAVHFTLHDLDRVLLEQVIQTPHQLQHLPDDALFLINLHCPRFTYRREAGC
ncbi:serine-rich p40 protein [Blackberry virus E]|uniref:Serine-rich p40 protein n=1 Tax=Blackberry virus E TaxID=1043184 RepID=F8VAG2_9VIRU|nr:serine-rich p40 protein [Blackberry virus E]AEI17900.1 serine-rich p40 protein [Blackberry virus E]